MSPDQICVQVAHACIESTKNKPYIEEHPHLVICGVDNETKLNSAVTRLESLGVRLHKFREADINDQLTAIASEIIYDTDRRHFRRYQLLKIKPEAQKPIIDYC